MAKIIIADDHLIVRQMLAEYLNKAPGIDVVGQAASADEAIELASSLEVDLVVLDMLMPDDDCPETIRELKELPKPPKILIVTGARENECSLHCMQAGADGYLSKTSQGNVLVEAINRLLTGGKFISPRIAAKLVWALDDPGPIRHDKLSKREFQVFSMLGRGLTLTEISKQLTLSIKTISTYRSRILEKMHFKNNADLMRYSLRSGLDQ